MEEREIRRKHWTRDEGNNKYLGVTERKKGNAPKRKDKGEDKLGK